MQEVAFLKKNAEYWKRVEALIETDAPIIPDELLDLYIRLTDDLAYSRTFYPRSKTTVYLNTLTSRIHQQIYKSKSEKRNRFKKFWFQEIPQLVYKHRSKLAYSLLIFTLAVVIGVVSAANDKTFVRLILGDSYVNMTLENIKKGDPLAVYKSMGQVEMFLGITINNIMVSFFVYVTGLLLAFGTAYQLFQNGVMLGAFQYFFYEHNYFYQSMLIVWLHGTLEISAIIIAGGAGLTMGSSLLFPRTYSRMESFRRGATEGMKIVIGLVPVFMMAGFIEGFVTRYTNMSLIINFTIILTSFGFVIFYFVIYPYLLHRKSVQVLKNTHEV